MPMRIAQTCADVSNGCRHGRTAAPSSSSASSPRSSSRAATTSPCSRAAIRGPGPGSERHARAAALRRDDRGRAAPTPSTSSSRTPRPRSSPPPTGEFDLVHNHAGIEGMVLATVADAGHLDDAQPVRAADPADLGRLPMVPPRRLSGERGDVPGPRRPAADPPRDRRGCGPPDVRPGAASDPAAISCSSAGSARPRAPTGRSRRPAGRPAAGPRRQGRPARPEPTSVRRSSR